MSDLFGGGSSKTGYNVTGGGTGAPWNWGVSPFDQTQIADATASNTQAIGNRYDQLGLGGSTAEQTDLTQAGNMGDAMTGQLQTANVGNAALNPALQPQLNSLVGVQSGGGSNASGALGTLLGAGLKAL